MIIFKQAAALQKHLQILINTNRSIGFVPTMGALHQGHLSLIERSKSMSDVTVCSIFINPTQFNNAADFEKYPVTLSEDIYLLEKNLCDILFVPPVSEIYPAGLNATRHYNLERVENILEGEFRPGHFQGVCQVIERLLNIVQPAKLFLGQKDFQQQLVIKHLVKELQLPVSVVSVPTLREPSGLAMSSRNMRLNTLEKDQAAAIYKMLVYLKNNFAGGNFTALEDYASRFLLHHGFDKVDYVKIVNAETLQAATRWDGIDHLVAVVAAFIGEVRLIDNMVITRV